jgi:hypothetical protein
MEALLQLEKVQRVLSLMGSRGLSDPTAAGGGGDRFLAHFLLFMVWFIPFSSAVSRIKSPWMRKLCTRTRVLVQRLPVNEISYPRAARELVYGSGSLAKIFLFAEGCRRVKLLLVRLDGGVSVMYLCEERLCDCFCARR